MFVLAAIAAGLGAAAGSPATERQAALQAVASMTAAIDRGDPDEASRLGMLAGPATVEQALTSRARLTRLAGVAAAPAVEGRTELLPALAALAADGDRRAAIPAARAARTIARELARMAQSDALADDLDPDDVATWHSLFDALARNSSRFIEVRVLALDTVVSLAQVTALAPSATALDPIGFDLVAALGDPDPAFRAIAIELVPRPTPPGAYAPLAATATNDADPAIALAAARVLCGDDRPAAVTSLGPQGLDRLKKLVAGTSPRMTREARRCLAR